VEQHDSTVFVSVAVAARPNESVASAPHYPSDEQLLIDGLPRCLPQDALQHRLGSLERVVVDVLDTKTDANLWSLQHLS
jgi:hypothetical protein